MSLIMIDSLTTVNRKYYPQILLEECKYEIKKTKIETLINDESSSDDEYDNECDNESGNESNNK